ncbi:MAG TPA: hypothetical protein VEH27_03845 [Methylomirabilota bacterium]|nr:hypothetical protein [Methylomirabilota bacterium]
MANILRDLREAMRARILSDSYFATAPAPTIIREEHGDINTEIDTEVAKIGCCLLLATPFGEVRDNNKFEITPKIGIFENVTVNRSASGTNKFADEIALQLIGCFLNWQPPAPWRPFAQPAFRLVEVEPELQYELAWSTGTIIHT